MKLFNICLSLFILLSIFTICTSTADDCVYLISVRTGTVRNAGTNSIVGLTLSDASGSSVRFPNLASCCGAMGSGHDYFENGNLDIFSTRATCLDGPVCAMNLTSDGSGRAPGWYVQYVLVTSVGGDQTVYERSFIIEQWLATDEPPYQLYATRNNCPYGLVDGQEPLRMISTQ